MTGKQQAVMWMALTLVILRLFTSNQWKDIWNTVLKGSGSSLGGSSGGGGLTIPDPLLPGPLGSLPGLGIPLSTASKGGTFNA